MTLGGLTLDAGALIALERGNRRCAAILRRAVQHGLPIAVPAGVVAQVWRDGRRQAHLARLLSAAEVTVVDLDGTSARLCGVLLGRSGGSDVIDASVVVCARERAHTVVTSDAGDLRRIDPRLPVIDI